MRIRIPALVLAVVAVLAACSVSGVGASTTAGSSGTPTTAESSETPSTAAAPADATPVAPGISAERVTDVAAKAITDEQLQFVLATCQSSSGVPGIDEDCMNNSVEDLALPDCTFQDQLCLATGALTELDSEVVQVIDGRPGRPACSGEGAELCAGVVVAAAAATEPRSEPSDTQTEPTEETERPTEPTPSEDTEPPTAPTREDEDAEPSGTGS